MRLVTGTARVDDVDDFVERLGAVGGEHGVAVQAFDADYVADRRHLAAAVEHADRAFDRGENVASDRAVEVLLYAAGRRQIREALEMGVGEGEQAVVVVVHDADGGDEAAAADAVAGLLGEAPRASESSSERRQGGGGVVAGGGDLAAALGRAGADAGGVVGDPGTLREFFAVSDAELAAAGGDLAGVVRERVALLDVEK